VTEKKTLIRARRCPLAAAVAVVLALPDGKAGFDLIDNPSTGRKGIVTMGGGNAHPHRDVSDFEQADAMGSKHGMEREAGGSL
jgi:hypothetical protein